MPLVTAARLYEVFGIEPFTTADIDRVGITRDMVRSAVNNRTVQQLRRGVFRVPPTSLAAEYSQAEALQLAKAVVRAIPSAIASHETAARIHGLPLVERHRMWSQPHTVTLTMPDGGHIGRDGYRMVSAKVPADQIVEIDGLRVTSVMRTAVDVARGSDLRGGLVVCDGAMRLLIADHAEQLGADLRELVHDKRIVEDLRREFREIPLGMKRWPGVVNAKKSIKYAHPGAESALESVSRGNVIHAELPIPLVNWPVTIDGVTFWVDMLWEEQKLIGEADGKMKYTSNEVLYREKQREDWLRSRYAIERWGWFESFVEPFRMMSKITPHFSRHSIVAGG